MLRISRNAHLALAFLLVVVVLPTQRAQAQLSWETGVVTYVADGDTFDVDLGGTVERIRIIGINAMEIGDCNADAATQRLKELIGGRTVSIGSIDPDVESRGRMARHVFLDGVNIGEQLASEGLVLPFPHPTETTYNSDYIAAADAAQAAEIGIWDSTACGSGPSQSNELRIWVKYDANGDDTTNLNGEWIKIQNRGSSGVSLEGWSVRDSALNIYSFPADASLLAGGTVTVHVGSGTETADTFYWGMTSPIFNNAVGDGAYLIDPDGDIRAFFTYPCHAECTDPLQGSILVTANYNASGDDATNPNGEWVNITNISSAVIDLQGYLLESWPYSYEFDANSKINPGERMRVYIGSGNSARLKKYWGKSKGILDNNGDTVKVTTFDTIDVAAFSYPCDPVCSTPPGLIIDKVVYDAPGDDLANPNGEWIRIKNVGSYSVDFRDWQIYSWPYSLTSNLSRIILPGATLTVYIGEGDNTDSTMYWGKSKGILNNGGDLVELRTPHRDVADCDAWGSSACPGDGVASKLMVTANFNAPGNDLKNPNGEWVNITNTSSSVIDLEGYQIEAFPEVYTLGTNSEIKPGERMRIYIGKGSETRLKKYWGNGAGILRNFGEYVRLRDANGAAVKHFYWPCTPCGPIPDLEIYKVNYNAPGDDTTNPNGEWIVIKNMGFASVDLRDWQIQSPPYQINPTASRIMNPGDTVTIYIGTGTNTSTALYWGKSKGILNNSGDRVLLYTPHRDLADCTAWGTSSCP
jgi:endonuclease YncB( thermonuclease family)/P pilus assembly chaperone PapD